MLNLGKSKEKSKLSKFTLTFRNYVYLPLLITLRGSKRVENIGVAVFKLAEISSHPSVVSASNPIFHNFKKLSLLEVVGYIGIVLEMYL